MVLFINLTGIFSMSGPESAAIRPGSRPGRVLAVTLCLATLWASVAAGPAAAHEGEQNVLEEVVVKGRRLNLAGEARSASEGVIGHEDLALRPLLRPGDVLESIPGLIMTQHSGSGKSNQMFLRGFNLDHGTDFSTRIDGMPVNLPTHGHGQGYTDINFLIPELIRTIDYAKGPYHAELGDFSSAGGAHIRTFDRLPGGQLTAGAGDNGFLRALAAGDRDLAGGRILGAIESQLYDGPWSDIDEDVRKINGLLRWTGGEDLEYGITAMYFDNRWNSADQIPARAVEQGLIDPLGSIDRTLGGNTRRMSLSATLVREDGAHRDVFNAWLIDYDFQLWSNFTYLLDDPVNGDQFEQLDNRLVYGGDWSRNWLGAFGGGHLHHTVGLQLRHDDIDTVGLIATRARERIGVKRLDKVRETGVGAFYELEWRLDDRWRSVLGLRGDYYWFDVSAQRPENSGSTSDGIISPKASVIYTLSELSEAYLSGGFGFHSNDARGTTVTVDPVSGEAKAGTLPWRSGTSSWTPSFCSSAMREIPRRPAPAAAGALSSTTPGCSRTSGGSKPTWPGPMHASKTGPRKAITFRGRSRRWSRRRWPHRGRAAGSARCGCGTSAKPPWSRTAASAPRARAWRT
jgi:outer membrane receptor protein involved in Fe transport